MLGLFLGDGKLMAAALKLFYGGGYQNDRVLIGSWCKVGIE